MAPQGRKLRAPISGPSSKIGRVLGGGEDGRGQTLVSKSTSKAVVDVAQYWEKRKIQDALRRFLEALQEKWGLEDGTDADDCLNAAWSTALAQAKWPLSPDGEKEAEVLTESQFVTAFAELKVWPPELSPQDRTEVYAALVISTVNMAKQSTENGEPSRTHFLSRARFCEGFACVPFNLPDFPVQEHLIPVGLCQERRCSSEQLRETAEAIARRFRRHPEGRVVVKDFYDTGIISTEEIQAGLPHLLPCWIIEEAVERIIRLGAPLFNPQEWQSLVVMHRNEAVASLTKTGAERTGHPRPEPKENQLRRARKEMPVSEPMPTRELRSEEPVQFLHENISVELAAKRKGSEPVAQRVVNWETAKAKKGQTLSARGELEHDDMAFPRQSFGTRRFNAMARATRADGDEGHGSEHLAWISLSFHNECGGPYLASAFALCCERYQSHYSSEGKTI